MNFDFMMECEIKDPKIKAAYDEIYKELVDAEAHYWKEPQQSGILFRKTAERICRFYNDYYEIGFPEGTLLEEFLCYTDKEEHNVLVSRFFSMVKDQRDRLNKLRVLGDDCIWGEEGPDRGMEFCDRMAQDAEKMADAMMEVIKDMCRHFNGRTDVDDRLFYIDWVPDYSEEERFPKKEEVKKRRLSIFSRFFGGKAVHKNRGKNVDIKRRGQMLSSFLCILKSTVCRV